MHSAPLTEATYLILLSLVTPKHGYAIMQDVAAWSGEKNKLGPGTLYGALTKLLDQGLIERVDGPNNGDERRKCYLLTPTGRGLLERESERLARIAALGRRVLEENQGKEGR